MQPHPVRKAIIQFEGKERTLLLFRLAEKQFRWQTESGDLWEPCQETYVDWETAVKQIRVAVDTDPKLVGAKLWIKPMEPPAEVRAAVKIAERYSLGAKGPRRDAAVEDIAKVIRETTNIGDLVEHFNNLIAYCFKCRIQFAMGVCPPTPGMVPRDLTMDGLLLECVTALEVTMDQKLPGLINKLKEQPSLILQPGQGPIQ